MRPDKAAMTESENILIKKENPGKFFPFRDFCFSIPSIFAQVQGHILLPGLRPAGHEKDDPPAQP